MYPSNTPQQRQPQNHPSNMMSQQRPSEHNLYMDISKYPQQNNGNSSIKNKFYFLKNKWVKKKCIVDGAWIYFSTDKYVFFVLNFLMLFFQLEKFNGRDAPTTIPPLMKFPLINNLTGFLTNTYV